MSQRNRSLYRDNEGTAYLFVETPFEMSEVDAELGFEGWMAEVRKIWTTKRLDVDESRLEAERWKAAFDAGWSAEQFATQPGLPIRGQNAERRYDGPEITPFLYTASVCALVFVVLNWLLPAYLQNKVAGGLRVDDVNSWTTTLSHISIWFREHRPLVAGPVGAILMIWLGAVLVARMKGR